MGFLEKLLKKKAKESAPFCSVVVVAAGQASRMEGIDKILCPMGGEAIVLHAIAPFQASDLVDEIVIVTRPDLILPITDLTRSMPKVKAVVAGGSSRQESVNLGLNALSDKVKLVAVQDGARPLISMEVIDRTVRAAHTYGAAAPAVPVTDTVKVADENGLVTATPDRSKLFAVQTPQVFDAQLLRAALQAAKENGAAVTDDCSAVEMLGKNVYLTDGSYENISNNYFVGIYRNFPSVPYHSDTALLGFRFYF